MERGWKTMRAPVQPSLDAESGEQRGGTCPRTPVQPELVGNLYVLPFPSERVPWAWLPRSSEHMPRSASIHTPRAICPAPTSGVDNKTLRLLADCPGNCIVRVLRRGRADLIPDVCLRSHHLAPDQLLKKAFSAPCFSSLSLALCARGN